MQEATSFKNNLVLHPPTAPEFAPSMIQLQRDRDVELPWLDVLQEAHRTLAMGVPEKNREAPHFKNRYERNPIKQYFEAHWLQHKAVEYQKKIITKMEKQNPAVLGDEDSEESSEAIKPIIDTDFMMAHFSGTYYDDSGSGRDVRFKPFTNKLCVKHSQSERIYVLLDDKNNPFIFPYESSLDGDERYEKVWDLTFSICHVLPSNEDNEDKEKTQESYKTTLPRVEMVNAVPNNIRFEFNRLEALKDLASSLSDSTKLKNLIDQDVNEWWNNPDLFDEGKEKYIKFKSLSEDIKILKSQLAQIAQEHGLYLCLKDRKFEFPPGALVDGKEVTEDGLKEGSLYQVYDAQVRWTIKTPRSRTVVSYGRSRRRRVRRVAWTEVQPHSKTMKAYRKVSFGSDPIDDKISDLRDIGKKVFIVNRTKFGYKTEEGESLADVMEACEASEKMRLQTVIAIKEYETLVTDQPRVLGASFYLNPLPSMFTEQFPQLALREDLSYTLQWNGCELGQLLESIPLAPGEERTVSVSVKSSAEKSYSSESSSSASYSNSQSSDFTMEFQNEVGREFTKTKTKTSSVSASGSFGGFGAKASTKSTKTSTLKNFSKSMQKVARKAARKVSANTKVTTTVKSSQKIATESSKTVNYTVSNINAGTTLNIMLYQINNRFKGGLFLDDVKLVVTGGRELLANTGIYEEQEFELDKLADAIEEFHPDKLPIEISGKEEMYRTYWSTLLKRLIEVFEHEYNVTSTSKNKKEIIKENQNTSTGLMSFSPGRLLPSLLRGSDYAKKEADLKSSGDLKSWISNAIDEDVPITDLFYAVEEILESATIRPDALIADSIVVASQGIYADSLLGAAKATEPYSESMRKLELSEKQASIKNLESNNLINIAKAASLHSNIPYNTITEISMQKENTLSFRTRKPLDDELHYICRIANIDLALNGKIVNKEGKYLISFAENADLELLPVHENLSLFQLIKGNGEVIGVNA